MEMSIRAQAERIGFQIVGELTRCIEREPTHLYQCYFDEAMKLNGNLKKQVEETTNKESLIEQAGPQVKQTTLLAGPIYIGQAQGEINI